MKILITGSAGFIGSHLAWYHLQKGDEVWGVDSLITGSLHNLKKPLQQPHFHFDQAELITWNDLDKALAWADVVYHMSALLGLKYVFNHPFDVISQNIHSLERILSRANLLSKPLKILVASSSCVYGSDKSSIEEPETAPMIVSSNTYIQETYATSKIVNEIMSLCLSHHPHLHVVIARFFNIIGINQTGRYGMVVPTFIQQAVNNEPITVYGDGTQTRSFCSVYDAIAACDRLLQSAESKNEIFNIGNQREISILDLAHLVKKITGSLSPIVFVPYEKAYGIQYRETERRQPNIIKINNLIGFNPKVSLETCIEEIAQSLSKD
ncbi:MAG: NAD-dependent epimerase/dehydratase family protein [Chlamydiia bacterium]|nr:NAD-dependent epimerase/dehydratase family protein [Chlamydiia bacterium]